MTRIFAQFSSKRTIVPVESNRRDMGNLLIAEAHQCKHWSDAGYGYPCCCAGHS